MKMEAYFFEMLIRTDLKEFLNTYQAISHDKKNNLRLVTKSLNPSSYNTNGWLVFELQTRLRRRIPIEGARVGRNAHATTN